MIEGKGLGGKRVCRRSVSLSNEYDKRLVRLAKALNVAPATLAAELVMKGLDDMDLVRRLQDDKGIEDYVVVPVRNYILGEWEFRR